MGQEMKGSVLEADGLVKRYDPPKGVLAVDGVSFSFSIAPGEVFSLLGPNLARFALPWPSSTPMGEGLRQRSW